MKFSTFLDDRCERLVCEDCRNQAEEYTTLLMNRTYALALNEDKRKRAEVELQQARRELAMWKELAEMPFDEIIRQWMEAKTAEAMEEGRKQAQAQFSELDKQLFEIEKLIKRTKGKKPNTEAI